MHFTSDDEGGHKRVLRFVFALPSPGAMADIAPLLALVPLLIDLVRGGCSHALVRSGGCLRDGTVLWTVVTALRDGCCPGWPWCPAKLTCGTWSWIFLTRGHVGCLWGSVDGL